MRVENLLQMVKKIHENNVFTNEQIRRLVYRVEVHQEEINQIKAELNMA